MIPIHRRTRFDVTRRACRVGDGSIYVYGSIGDRTVASVSRAMKRVERFDGDEWQTSETRAYTYDAFGRTISQSGPLADVFRHRFSTKYFDLETGLYYYGYRFYSIALMRWLSRDPLHEEGGLNLYCFCINSSCSKIDPFGKETMVIKHLPGEDPMTGWARSGCLAETVYKSANQITTSYPGSGGKIRFHVEINPPLVFIDVYFKMGVDFLFAYHFEEDHISVAKRHDAALWQYKYKTEAINECPREAYRLQHKYMDEFEKISRQLKAENAAYDSPGGKHIINWYPGRN